MADRGDRVTLEVGRDRESILLLVDCQKQASCVAAGIELALTTVAAIEADWARPNDFCEPLEIKLSGPGTRTPESLERILRAAIRTMGHDENELYRVDVEGSADYERVKQYYG